MPKVSLTIAGVSLLIAFALGVMFGEFRQRVRREVTDFSAAIGRSFFLSQHADVQYCNADYEAAHEAMTDWLTHLEQTRPVDGEYRDPLMTVRGIAIDKALVLGRLAVLEERRDRHELGKQYWERAGREAKAAAWKDFTEQGVRVAVQRLDQCPKRTEP